ncbi:hypothetical protein [Blastopirellula sp. J2-11]|nr:hypothetical protein [Blastopirellula sp. J2-11]
METAEAPTLGAATAGIFLDGGKSDPAVEVGTDIINIRPRMSH